MSYKRCKGKMKVKNRTSYTNENGITLIALVITIVVLLILAAVSISAIFSENGIIKKAQSAQSKMNEAENSDLAAINGLNDWMKKQTGGNGESATEGWVQNRTIVTNGETTLNVGDVYDYNCGVSSYTGGWKVLGAENGKLLIMSTVEIGSLRLSGGEGYNTGVTQLNNMCAPYGTNARSVTIEDINRVTGYTPAHQTITITSENKYYYDDHQTNQYTTNGSSTYKYADMASELGITDNKPITGNISYTYYPNTLNQNSSGTTVGIGTTSKAYELLFKEANNPSNCSYWIATSYVCASGYSSDFGLYFVVSDGHVGNYFLWNSYNGTYFDNLGVRAVVSL